MNHSWRLFVICSFFICSGFTFLKESSIKYENKSFSPNNNGKIRITGEIENTKEGVYPANINYESTKLKIDKDGKFVFYLDAADLNSDKVNIGVEINHDILVSSVKINLEKYQKREKTKFKKELVNELLDLMHNRGLSILNQEDGIDKNLIPGLDSVPLSSKTVVIESSDNQTKSMRIFVMENDEDYAVVKDYFLNKTNFNFNPLNLNSFQLRSQSKLLSHEEKMEIGREKILEAKKIFPLAYSGVAYNDNLNLFVQFDSNVRYSVIDSYKAIITDEQLLLDSADY
ncbi:hypothetical protein [Enterococcus sp. DIV0187]|uniref:hypothetical protein n=1 Tax=Enterococcus sp. DIV0187 TaxID=2774644 RepID=UPI003F23B025